MKAHLIGLDDAAPVQRVMESDPAYAHRVSGTTPGPDAAWEVLTASPPNINVGQKLDLGLWEDDRLVAFADVIVGWPVSSAAHIGLLMAD